MKQLNIGIIGAGRIGKVHAQSITYNVPTAKVLGITDVFKDGLQELADKYGIEKVYNDYKEMLADEEIDAVLVCSSTDTHADISIEAAKAGTLTIEKLEAMTAVCSVGLDMIVLPGEAPAETISAIIADEAAIGMVNSKTTAVRIIPAPGKVVGDRVEMGGLLGSAPVMPVHGESAEDFIARGGRIPAPLQSLKN